MRSTAPTRSRPARRPRGLAARAAVLLAAVAAVVVAVVLLAGGGSEGGSRAAAPRPVDRLLGPMTRRYEAVQRDNGHFRGSIGGGTRYGDAYLGYAMLQTGIRARDPRTTASGLRGLVYSLPRAELHSRPSVFENLALAAGYNLARRHLADDPLFRRTRREWESFLRRCELIRIPAETYFGNHWLIEAVEIQELLRTGLRSSSPTAVLGGQRSEAARLARELVDVRIPAMARREAVPAPGGRAFVLSDPPDNPLAYQGLSLGFYARAVELLGDRATPVARRTLLEIARASLLLAAPDGDVAYFGRNQEEAWGLAGTAYGAYEAAALDESAPGEDAQLRELAARALDRLAVAHGVSFWGLEITPSAARSRFLPPADGLDRGAGGPSFGGLVMAMLEWARPAAEPPPEGASIPADRPLRTKLSHSESRFAVVRSGPVWAAIRPTTSGKHPYDVRNDFGLVALKVRTGGRWVDAVRLRPITEGGADSAGPVLHTPAGTGFPFATEVGIERDGTVTMRGGWRREPARSKRTVARLPSGGTVRALASTPGAPLRTGVTFRFEPLPCGMRMTFPVRAGDAFDYSAFLLPQGLSVRPASLRDATSRVALSRPARVSVEDGYASATDPALVRARASWRPSAGGSISVTHCASGNAPDWPRPAPMTRG
ncbi:MAG TPA: hypothetical protein VF520_04735 [Thermoleophilaceae bacterium]